MFCTNCGTMVKGLNFCGSCGTKVEELDSMIQKNETSDLNEFTNMYNDEDKNVKQSSVNTDRGATKAKYSEEKVDRTYLQEIVQTKISEYYDQYGNGKKLLSIDKYFNKMNYTRKLKMWPIVGTLLGTAIVPGKGTLIGFIIGCGLFQLVKYNALDSEEAKESNIVIFDITRMVNFINSTPLHNSVEVDTFETNEGDESITFLFNNQTYHKVVIDKSTKSYVIKAIGLTTRARLIGMSRMNGSLRTRNCIKINPIIHGYIEYMNKEWK